MVALYQMKVDDIATLNFESEKVLEARVKAHAGLWDWSTVVRKNPRAKKDYSFAHEPIHAWLLDQKARLLKSETSKTVQDTHWGGAGWPRPLGRYWYLLTLLDQATKYADVRVRIEPVIGRSVTFHEIQRVIIGVKGTLYGHYDESFPDLVPVHCYDRYATVSNESPYAAWYTDAIAVLDRGESLTPWLKGRLVSVQDGTVGNVNDVTAATVTFLEGLRDAAKPRYNISWSGIDPHLGGMSGVLHVNGTQHPWGPE